MGYPVPRYGGGGAQFSPNASHVIWKQTVNMILAMCHQADPAHCDKFIIHSEFAVHIFYNIILGQGKRTKSQNKFLALQIL
jgi:hypothetical protein